VAAALCRCPRSLREYLIQPDALTRNGCFVLCYLEIARDPSIDGLEICRRFDRGVGVRLRDGVTDAGPGVIAQRCIDPLWRSIEVADKHVRAVIHVAGDQV
jgi:hypothetical protein